MNYKIATCWSVLAGAFRPLCVLKAPVLQVDSFQIAREDWGWECAWEGIMESLSRVASDALGKLLQWRTKPAAQVRHSRTSENLHLTLIDCPLALRHRR